MASARIWATPIMNARGVAPRALSPQASYATGRHYAYQRLPAFTYMRYSSSSDSSGRSDASSTSSRSSSSSTTTTAKPGKRETAKGKYNLYGDNWEDTADFAIKSFSDLPHEMFGHNQHMLINYDLKEAMRIMLRQFNAPIVYCFAYGSGVFPQEEAVRSISEADFRSVHPKPPKALIESQKGAPKMIDFIFGVSHTQHWHSVNMKQHRNHYSGVASLGSGFVSRVQDWGAGVYFHPYVEVNGMLIKYGVTSIDNLVTDLSTWDSLYLAGRLQKPVKILRDHPQVRLANQHNLIAALRTALLLLPPDFTEAQLYSAISGISYLGDPRMSLPTENRSKVDNIVSNNMVHFRRLYAPLIKTLPNVTFLDDCRLDDENWVLNPKANSRLQQDMDPSPRGNMVRRLPTKFRSKLYFQYQKKLSLPKEEFSKMMKASSDDEGKRQGGEFEKRIAEDDPAALTKTVRQVIKQTVNWPSTVQSLKGPVMSGWGRTFRYLGEKYAKYKKGSDAEAAAKKTAQSQDQSKGGEKPKTSEASEEKKE